MRRNITEQQRVDLGNEFAPGAPAAVLFWLAEQGRLDSGLIPVSLADFVLSTICDSEPGAEITNAMAYGLLNLKSLDWHEEVISGLGLDQLRWPPVRRYRDIVGYLKIGADTIPCYAPIGDYQAALAGALLTRQELSLNISTGSQVSRLTEGPLLGNYQTRPFFDDEFANLFSHLPAGRSLNVPVDLISEFAMTKHVDVEDIWDYIARAADDIHDTDLQVNLGFFPGPCGNEGAISSIREKNLTVGNLFRASFDNMAENYHKCALRLWPDQSWERIVFSGGVARKFPLLRALIEKRLRVKSRLCPLEEDTLLGLMVLSRVGSGRGGSVGQSMDDLSRHYASNPPISAG